MLPYPGALSLGEGGTPLVELRFTHRQRLSMEGMAFLLEEIGKGESVDVPDADAHYLHGDAGPPSGATGRERARCARARQDLLDPVDRGHCRYRRRRSGGLLACEHLAETTGHL